jgi:hypothetical protein
MAAFYYHRDCGNGHPEGWYRGGVYQIGNAPDWVVQRYGSLDQPKDPNHVLVKAIRTKAGQ